MKAAFPVLVFVFALGVAGCHGGAAASSDSPTSGGDTSASNENLSGLTKMKIEDVKVGKGNGFPNSDRPAAVGDRLFMIYTGKFSNGTVFDSNDTKDKPVFSFVLGAKMVIPGWDQGLVGMKVGGERKLSIPYTLGYGEKGQGKAIPPKADLYFDVKLLDMVKKGEEDIADQKVLSEGSGQSAKKGDTVSVTYVVKSIKNDVVQDNSKKPVTFKVGSGDALPAIDAAVMGMKQGEVKDLHLNPSVGVHGGKIGMSDPSKIELTLKSIG